MNYKPDKACFDAAHEASGGKLAAHEINEAFQKIADEKERLKSSGKSDRMAERLAAFAEKEAERTRIAAALQKRHAALNILVKDRLHGALKALMAQGLKPHQALMAIMEGTQKGVAGGRASVEAMKLAFSGRYVTDMLAQMQREAPHLEAMLTSPAFDRDVMREMMELREGGAPGVTKNKDAVYAAKIFATYAEMSRVELNKLGASIGKLDGWAGAQTHDDIKMIRAGKEAWVASIRPLLDTERTFPGAQSEAEVRDILDEVYDTIITGISGKMPERPASGRVNPANLANSLGKSRVLHFKDADSVLAYRDQFGYGNTIQGILAHQTKAAHLAAQMETYGPNPENMLQQITDKMRDDLRSDTKLSPAEKNKLAEKLRFDSGNIRNAFDIMSGLASRPVNGTMADIGNGIRTVQGMAKLGGVVISSAPADTVTTAIASQFRGGGFWHGLTDMVGGILKGRPKGEQKEITYLVGEGAETLSKEIMHAALGHDIPLGKVGRAAELFFKYTGMTWWDQVGRGVAARNVAAEMGMRAKTAFKDLPAAYSHVLGLHGIDEARWEVLRKAEARVADGRSYITPDRVRALSDEDVRGLVKMGADTPAEHLADLHDRARFDLEMKVRAFVADETRYGMLQTDARSRRTTTWGGLRPGTFAGEATRFIMQFKGFPIAFTQRVGGRAVFGMGQDAKLLGSQGAHIATIISGLGAAGYLAMVAKDTAKGYWPPRNPADPKTIIAAFQQGGALGIYGDYLFGQSNRFGNSALETAAGPTIGSISQIVNAALKTRDYLAGKLDGGKSASPAADWINAIQGNTPFANLFYVKPALDYLVLNAVKDWATPGHTQRAAQQRMKDYGQRNVFATH